MPWKHFYIHFYVQVSVVKRDKKLFIRCYESSLKVKRVRMMVGITQKSKTHKANFVDLYQKEEYNEERLISTKDFEGCAFLVHRVSKP